MQADYVLIEDLTEPEISDETLFTVCVILDEIRLEDEGGNFDVNTYAEAKTIADDLAKRLGLTIKEAKSGLTKWVNR